MIDKINKSKGLIICGPTASGKTDYAHKLALKNTYRGTTPCQIVNCDSMQVYKQIPVITASPEGQLQDEVPYHLYNFKDISEDFSVAEYIELASATIRQILTKSALPIIVGGTGMYISSLLNGINTIPDIDPEIRQRVRGIYEEKGVQEIYSQLSRLDPVCATKLNEGDSQRIMRALEVMIHSGKSILEFQQMAKKTPLPEVDFQVILLLPARDFLYQMCNDRLAAMFENGAIEEVETILKSDARFGISAGKALAVSQIISYLQGDISKEEALRVAAVKTRQYAKRQTTWFKHQLNDKTVIEFNSMEEYKQILAKL